jgi:DNA-binding NarL/FixJ family response regulator
MRVLLADDHRLMLDGVQRALEADVGFEIVGTTQDGTQVVPLVSKLSPDLVLLDVRMPGMDGLACLEEIHKRSPEIRVVMLSASASPGLIDSAARLGAAAYVSKTVDPTELPAILRAAVQADGFLTIGVTDDAGNSAARAGLTDREQSILEALAQGLSNDEIAKAFWVTKQTVKFHLTNIYRKLGARNRTEATRLAYQQGLVDIPLSRED